MAVNGVGSFDMVAPAALGVNRNQGAEHGTKGFADFLKDALDMVNDMQIQSEKAAEEFAAGKTDNIHQVMIAAEKADIALQFTMQIRNKIMDAYNEIMRMQI